MSSSEISKLQTVNPFIVMGIFEIKCYHEVSKYNVVEQRTNKDLGCYLNFVTFILYKLF